MPPCPKCKTQLYLVCSNPKCSCHDDLPEGSREIIPVYVLFGRINLPSWLGRFIWLMIRYLNLGYWVDEYLLVHFHILRSFRYKWGFMPRHFLNEEGKCPVCKHTADIDLWAILEDDESFPIYVQAGRIYIQRQIGGT